MKKVALFLSLIFVLCIFCSCDPKPNKGGSTDGNSQVEQGGTTDGNTQEELKPDDNSQEQEITKMYITIYGNKLEVTLENNSSVKALVELLKQGNITYTANDYGGFEKVGNIGHSLPQNNTSIDTQPGDVILYQGNQLCLYYGNNSWNFTRIGKISGYTANELRNLLGAGKGSVEVTVSLN